MSEGVCRYDIAAPWRTFCSARAAGDQPAALRAIQEFIHAWDDAFWANDFSSFGDVYTDDVELVNRSRMGSILGPAPARGLGGFARIREDIAEVAHFFRFDIEEVRNASGDKVVALGSLRARSRYAGMVMRTGFATVWTLQGQRICRAEAFTSKRAALRAAGLDARSVPEEEWSGGGFAHAPGDKSELPGG